jgi:hypothetical protein
MHLGPGASFPFRLTKDQARSTFLAADRAYPGNAGATKGVWVMSTRRDLALGLILAGTASALAGGKAQAKVSEADALEALNPWLDAVFTGDPAVVDKVLAEEFQILRSNGGGHDKASYLKALPKQTARPKFSDIIATGNGETLVIRYKLETEQTIDGIPFNGISPRLSVFRKDAGRWLMVAHANFAQLAA